MNIALIRLALDLSELDQLIKEFPQYLFLSYPESVKKTISPEHWAKVEILFGSKLTPQEFSYASQLRWIHTPYSHYNRLPLSEIEKSGSVLVSVTIEDNRRQIAEYVLSLTLAFGKNLFDWKIADQSPETLIDAKGRQDMWTLQDKVLLQIGIDKAGKEIIMKAHQNNMRCISSAKEATFHPFCLKNISYDEIRDYLPLADVVCLNLPPEDINLFQLEDLELMKDDSILICLGKPSLFDSNIDPALFEKFRGVALDIPFQSPLSPKSNLWKIPNLLITPEIAPRPKFREREAFRLFRFNLRQYIHENYIDMKNLVDTSIILENITEKSF